MPVLEKNSTLTLLKIASSITFTNFALAVGLYNARKFSDFKANVAAKFGRFRKSAYICTRFWSEEREKAHSSIG